MNPCIMRPVSTGFTTLAFLLSAVVFNDVVSLAAPQNSQDRAVQQPAAGTTIQQTQVPPAAEGALTIGNLGTISYPPTWYLPRQPFDNAYELYRVAGTPVGPPPSAGQNAPVARILITTEERESPGEAVVRLQQVAQSRKADAHFYALSGWPAVELQFSQKLPRPGQEGPQGQAQSQGESTVPPQEDESQQDFSKPAPTVQRALVAVAVDNEVITFDLMLAPGTPKDVEQEGLQIVNDFVANQKSQPEVLQRSLQQLQQNYRKKSSPQSAPEPKRPPHEGSTGETGTTQVQDGGVGELEIAVNPDGKKIVIASNASLKFSGDGGKTFNSSTAPFGMNDPTMARGHSGDFYLGQIAFPTGTPGAKRGQGLHRCRQPLFRRGRHLSTKRVQRDVSAGSQ